MLPNNSTNKNIRLCFQIKYAKMKSKILTNQTHPELSFSGSVAKELKMLANNLHAI
jgi:hypothetical protein